MKASTLRGENLTALSCACANIRRAARAVTRLYDQELGGHGLEATQFTLLMALMAAGEVTQGRLGELLALDSTTLTRSLKYLLKEGLIRCRAGEDRRERLLSVTGAGKLRYERLLPRWEKAQKRLKAVLKEGDWSRIMQSVTELTRAALGASSRSFK